jgi:hypothetical protein
VRRRSEEGPLPFVDLSKKGPANDCINKKEMGMLSSESYSAKNEKNDILLLAV